MVDSAASAAGDGTPSHPPTHREPFERPRGRKVTKNVTGSKATDLTTGAPSTVAPLAGEVWVT